MWCLVRLTMVLWYGSCSHCVGLDDRRGGVCMQTLVTVRLDVFRHGMEHHGMFHLCQPVNVDIR